VLHRCATSVCASLCRVAAPPSLRLANPRWRARCRMLGGQPRLRQPNTLATLSQHDHRRSRRKADVAMWGGRMKGHSRVGHIWGGVKDRLWGGRRTQTMYSM
jgi:hypothetical protein